MWGCLIGRHARVGRIWAKNQKPSHRGSVLVNDLCGGQELDRGDLVGVEQAGVAGVRVLD